MPDFLHGSVQLYLDQLASGEPTPGGGSAAGLTGAMSAALLCMSARFTVGRDKYAAFQAQADAVLAQAEELRTALEQLAEEDALAYAQYRAAAALPKTTADEQAVRAQALQQATRVSIQAPMTVLRHCYRLLELADLLADHCNPYLVSDVATATHFALAAFRGALVNVRINLSSLHDAAYRDEITRSLDEMLPASTQLARTALEKAYQAMNLPGEEFVQNL